MILSSDLDLGGWTGLQKKGLKNMTGWLVSLNPTVEQPNLSGWWLVYPSEKYERQLGWLDTQYMGKFKKWQPNHQPVIYIDPSWKATFPLDLTWFAWRLTCRETSQQPLERWRRHQSCTWAAGHSIMVWFCLSVLNRCWCQNRWASTNIIHVHTIVSIVYQYLMVKYWNMCTKLP